MLSSLKAKGQAQNEQSYPSWARIQRMGLLCEDVWEEQQPALVWKRKSEPRSAIGTTSNKVYWWIRASPYERISVWFRWEHGAFLSQSEQKARFNSWVQKPNSNKTLEYGTTRTERQRVLIRWGFKKSKGRNWLKEASVNMVGSQDRDKLKFWRFLWLRYEFTRLRTSRRHRLIDQKSSLV